VRRDLNTRTKASLLATMCYLFLKAHVLPVEGILSWGRFVAVTVPRLSQLGLVTCLVGVFLSEYDEVDLSSLLL